MGLINPLAGFDRSRLMTLPALTLGHRDLYRRNRFRGSKCWYRAPAVQQCERKHDRCTLYLDSIIVSE